MIPHPFERFLGVESDADEYHLLGLTRDRVDALQVDDALRRRLAEVFRHPDGRSAEAEDVRVALREAADAVRRDLQREQRSTPVAEHDAGSWMSRAMRTRGRPGAVPLVSFNLTPFDRLVLSVLVACGGWNARSRAQLVALAQTYGVSVQGLFRVMQGLSAYAHSGGPRLGVREIAGGRGGPIVGPASLSAAPPIGPALLDRLADNLGQELKRGGAWPTIKLSLVFGALTLAASIIVLRLALTPSPRGGLNSASSVPPAQAESSAPATRASNAGSSDEGARIARFAKPPTFLGNGLPAQAVDAVDQLPAIAAQIDALGRKVAVADGAPSEAVFRQWDADIRTMATAWALGDASTRREIDIAIFEVLRAAADTPVVSDRLLKSLLPPATIAEPLDVWRGAWMAGFMARISSSPDLPPVVVDRARSQLEIALAKNLRGTVTFEAGGDQWLRLILPQLVQLLSFDDESDDAWELWLTAQRSLGEGERHDEAVADALCAVLRTDLDLSLPGRPVNVMGRLLDLVLRAPTGIARLRLLECFDDEVVTSRDLWVLTSLVSISDAAPWFSDRLVVPEDADMPHRWRVRDDLARVWPEPTRPAPSAAEEARPKFDPEIGGAWAALVERVLADAADDDHVVLMQQLIDASRLIEAAAALVSNMPDTAQGLVSTVEQGWAAIPATATRPAAGAARPRSGQAIGVDGVWAQRYADAGKNTQARCEAIQSLVGSAGNDLGPIDAAVLVREAYRGSPQDVRSTAQAVIVQLFTTGPVVAMQLLDQFADAPGVENVSDLIQGVTGRLLPGVRSGGWQPEARLALVHHVLSLRDPVGSPIDAMIEPLVASYMNRLALTSPETQVTTMPSTPAEAADVLLRGVLKLAEFAAPEQPTPADLPNLQRRHHTRLALAEGPIQSFVAHQLALLDATAYIVAAEQPALRSRAIELLRDRAASRSRAVASLQQARDVERAVLELWRLRLGFDPQAQTETGGST